MTTSDKRIGDLDLSAVRFEKPGYVELVFSLVIVWGFGDAVSTLVAAKYAGVHLEANPWMRLLLSHDPMLLVVLKAAVVLYAGVVLLECQPIVRSVPWWRVWLLGIIAAGAFVALSNTYIGLNAVSAAV